MQAHITISGSELLKLMERVRKLERAVQSASRRSADRAGEIIRTRFKSNLQQNQGAGPLLFQNINGYYHQRHMRLLETPRSRTWKFKNKDGHGVVIGALSGAAPHFHLIENGYGRRFRKKIGGIFRRVEIIIQLTGKNISGLEPPEARRTNIEPKEGLHHLRNALYNSKSQCNEAVTKIFKEALSRLAE